MTQKSDPIDVNDVLYPTGHIKPHITIISIIHRTLIFCQPQKLALAKILRLPTILKSGRIDPALLYLAPRQKPNVPFAYGEAFGYISQASLEFDAIALVVSTRHLARPITRERAALALLC
jgi:hypothetical protein